MQIYVYSDESGVFDYKHNNLFVFGGVVFISKDDKETNERKYLKAEKDIRNRCEFQHEELKACLISNKNKTKLYRSLNNVYKFGVVVEQARVNKNIFENKKSKQRYLNYVFKIALKRFFEKLIRDGVIDPNEPCRLNIFVDEHTTATDGRYELKEALTCEFKDGTFNRTFSVFHEPVFSKLQSLELNFCNSKNKTLVRAADIVANRIYYEATTNQLKYAENNPFFIFLHFYHIKVTNDKRRK